MELTEVREKIYKLTEQRAELTQEIIKLEKLERELRTGFKDGDLVENSKGQRGILILDDYFMKWKKLKKDGTPSKNITYLWDKPIKKVELGEG